MKTYVALLRGINVGGRQIRMVELKACFEKLGFSEVRTILQTGNVLFQSDETDMHKLRYDVESGVGEAFGYNAVILLYTPEEITTAVQKYPFDATDKTYQHYIQFVDASVKPADIVRAAPDLDDSVEAVEAGKGCVYWRVTKGQTLKSDFAKILTKAAFRTYFTSRNINTLQKIVAV